MFNGFALAVAAWLALNVIFVVALWLITRRANRLAQDAARQWAFHQFTTCMFSACARGYHPETSTAPGHWKYLFCSRECKEKFTKEEIK